MRKRMMMTVLAVGMMVVMGLAGCGAKNEQPNQKKTISVSGEKEEKDKESKNKSEKAEREKVDISKQTAKEVMLNIYGVEVPLVTTKEEIVEIGKKAGWAFYIRQSYIIAEFGDAKVMFRLKDGADASAPKEVYEIEFDDKVDWDKVQIYGMDAKRYIDSYEMNSSFYEYVNEEVRIDIFQYTFSISVAGNFTLTEVPEEEFRLEAYGYENVDYTEYGEDEYVNEVLRSILACEDLMELDYFYRNEVVGKIFQQLKTFEFGEMVMCGRKIDGSTVYTLLCEDDKNYSLHLKHDFTGDTVYIRDEWDVMEEIVRTEWNVIHNRDDETTAPYEIIYNHMTSACDKLISKGLITEYAIGPEVLVVETARGVEYEYPLGNPSYYDIIDKVFENLNTPNEEYCARREQ